GERVLLWICFGLGAIGRFKRIFAFHRSWCRSFSLLNARHINASGGQGFEREPEDRFLQHLPVLVGDNPNFAEALFVLELEVATRGRHRRATHPPSPFIYVIAPHRISLFL